MDHLKHFVIRHFEHLLVAIILIAAFLGTYLIEEESIVLNFYYLPVLVAGYFLGRRTGVLTAVFSVLAVLIFVLVFPNRFLGENIIWHSVAKLSSWGGFLILASVTVGSLYEENERRLQDLKNAYIGILEILSKYLESTDPYTKGHSVRVSELAMETAVVMNFPQHEIENIRVAGLLHDIGKIDISGEILRKAAQLTTEERELIDAHAVKGAYILSSVGSVLKEVVPIIVAHHKYFVETLDESEKDTGKIPLASRILAVADSFDAMVTDRPYRKGMPPWEALEEIVKNSGKQFDPEVVAAFKHVVTAKLEKV
ncbi:MAG: HD domain-containing phosphohydrolase [Thermodesulfobacteriota bacterium]